MDAAPLPARPRDDAPLERAVVYRAAQAPVLQAYVPLPVFGVECLLLLAGMRAVGFWSLLMLPLHLVLMIRTSEQPFWVADLCASYRHRWLVRNRDLHGRGVVSFTPHPGRAEIRS